MEEQNKVISNFLFQNMYSAYEVRGSIDICFKCWLRELYVVLNTDNTSLQESESGLSVRD